MKYVIDVKSEIPETYNDSISLEIHTSRPNFSYSAHTGLPNVHVPHPNTKQNNCQQVLVGVLDKKNTFKMPLPAALLAKLQKRGLVEKSETAQRK